MPTEQLLLAAASLRFGLFVDGIFLCLGAFFFMNLNYITEKSNIYHSSKDPCVFKSLQLSQESNFSLTHNKGCSHITALRYCCQPLPSSLFFLL